MHQFPVGREGVEDLDLLCGKHDFGRPVRVFPPEQCSVEYRAQHLGERDLHLAEVRQKISG